MLAHKLMAKISSEQDINIYTFTITLLLTLPEIALKGNLS